jgi:hypothetical protein
MQQMIRRGLALFLLAAGLSAPHGATAEFPRFSCRLLEAHAFLPELSTFSGYRWIECRVSSAAAVDVEGVSINNGQCQTFDYWFAGRRFEAGQPLYVPYACMSPVALAIAANGVISKVRLR